MEERNDDLFTILLLCLMIEQGGDKMANDWEGVDNPRYIPDVETDAGDYIRMDYEERLKRIEEMLNNEREAGK